MENTEENRNKLAEVVVDCWDMDDLVSFAIEKVEEEYEKDDELFREEWTEFEDRLREHEEAIKRSYQF